MNWFMRKCTGAVIALVLSLVLFAAGALAQAGPPANYGAKGALQDPTVTLEKALVYALQDEYLAQARYDAVIAKLGSRRPFTQIKAAEQRHIQSLLSLFRKYSLPVPPNNAARFVQEPESARAAFQAAVDAEIANIAMYDKFSTSPAIPWDVRAVMANLRDASTRHLAAFRRGLRRQG